MHISIRCLLAPVLSLLLGVSSLAFADEAADRAALEAAAQAWIKAVNARDADALAALATEDVVLLDPSGPPVSGREAVRATWRQALAVVKGQVTTATKEAVVVGDVAWRIGAVAGKQRNGDGISRGQSLEIWKRVNGQWKLHRLIPASILTQQKPMPRPADPVLDKPVN